MSHYHNNQLNMVGLDSESEEAPYTPTKATQASKRKRNNASTMNNVNSKLSEGVENGAAADDGAASHAYVDNNVGSPLFGVSNLQPSPPPPTFPSYDDQSYDAYLDDSHIDQSFIGSNMWNQVQENDNGHGSFAMHGDYEIGQALIQAVNDVDPVRDDDRFFPSGGLGIYQSDEHGGGDNVRVKAENALDNIPVSFTPNGDSEYEESDYDERRPSKAPKLNKDGIPRKPRQPRPKLLKWDDNDWKNVALGLVWACGENGIQIPFQQASQVVGESCTAGALQQALLKLRGKQIAEGYQIPSLRMAWTRKNKNASSSTSNANTKSQEPGMIKNMLPKKKPTRFVGNQSLIVTLKRAYWDADRFHLVSPYKISKASFSSNKARLARFQSSPFSAEATPSRTYQASSTFVGNPTPAASPTKTGANVISHTQAGLSARYGARYGNRTPPVTPSTKGHRRGRHNPVSQAKPMRLPPVPEVYRPKAPSPRSWVHITQQPTVAEDHVYTPESPTESMFSSVANNLSEELMYYADPTVGTPSSCKLNGMPYDPNYNGFGPGDDDFGNGMGGSMGGGFGAINPFGGQDMWTT
mgnify:CR=1 FL=1|tara:strand:+ start:2414 stop:4159 length:1746 start_codon:yes stop_codon:yes gene_type:complete